ncbi:MAG: MFS transporter [Gammaproteobacteria bacterium]|nr:MFS transporter [Gammaproteobacteria bacterium]
MHRPRLTLLTACLVAFLSCLGISLPYPVLAPLFMDSATGPLTQFLGLHPKFLLGLALSINPLGILLGGAVLGALSDRYGRRRIMLGSLSLASLGYGLTAVALWQGNYPLFLFARFATGICEGNISIARAIAADLHPHVDRHQAFGWMNSAIFLGWLVGPLVGGLSLPLGQTVPFLIAGLAMLPCLALILLVLAETAPTQGRKKAFAEVLREDNAFQLLKEPGVAALALAQLLWTLGLNAFYEFYPLWLVEHARFDSTRIGLTTAGSCLIMTLTSSLLWPRWGKRMRALSGALLGGSLFTALLWLFPLASPALVAVVIVLTGMPIAIYGAALPIHCSERFEHLGQGKIMGLLTTIFCLGNTLIALAGGLIALFDTRAVLWLGALLCSLALWRLHRLRREPRPPLVLAGDQA